MRGRRYEFCHYVGNPTASEVYSFINNYKEQKEDFCKRQELDSRPIIALLAGSRKQEIKDNLPAMMKVALHFKDYQVVLAGAPAIDSDYYLNFIDNKDVKVIYNDTYSLLANSEAALVTSGTATLETALFNVPQVVCYETPIPKVASFVRRHLIKVKYISLVNLIANKEVVKELVADTFTLENIKKELQLILPGGALRDRMLSEYKEIFKILGNEDSSKRAATAIIESLKNHS